MSASGPAHREEVKTSPLDWFACEHPERPITDRTIFTARCPRCVVALDAYVRREGADVPLGVIDKAGSIVRQRPAGECLADAVSA